MGEVLDALLFLEEWENIPLTLKSDEKQAEEMAVDHKQSEEMAVETTTKVETLTTSIIPTIKEKDIDAVMNLDEVPSQVPSPTKKGRISLGGDAPSLVA